MHRFNRFKEIGLNHIIRYLNRIWVLFILCVICYSLYLEPFSVKGIFYRFEILNIVLSLGLIVLGKFCVVYLVHLCLHAAGVQVTKLFTWNAYSKADVAKYLPGGIWGIAGRIIIYKQAGIPIKRGTFILMTETVLLIGFSVVVGLVFLMLYNSSSLSTYFIAFLILTASLLLFIVHAILFRNLPFLVVLFSFFVFIIMWIIFGSSFLVLVSDAPYSPYQVIAAFNLGFAAGQLAVFAPSGIGVREAVISSLFHSSYSGELREIIEIGIFHRVIWILADFAMLLVSTFFYNYFRDRAL